MPLFAPIGSHHTPCILGWPRLGVLLRDALPKRTLLICAIVVGLSTFILPLVKGYGTDLNQLVVLGAWGILAAITSDQYADSHQAQVWTIALLLNLLIFLIPAGLLWLVTRRKWGPQGVVATAVWCAVYLSCLFWAFPATDGP